MTNNAVLNISDLEEGVGLLRKSTSLIPEDLKDGVSTKCKIGTAAVVTGAVALGVGGACYCKNKVNKVDQNASDPNQNTYSGEGQQGIADVKKSSREDFLKFVEDKGLGTECPQELLAFVNSCNGDQKEACANQVGRLHVDMQSCFSHIDDEGVPSFIAVNLNPHKKGSRFITFRREMKQSKEDYRFNVFDDMTFSRAKYSGDQIEGHGKSCGTNCCFHCKWQSTSKLHRFTYDAEIDTEFTGTSVMNKTETLLWSANSAKWEQQGKELKMYVELAKNLR